MGHITIDHLGTPSPHACAALSHDILVDASFQHPCFHLAFHCSLNSHQSQILLSSVFVERVFSSALHAPADLGYFWQVVNPRLRTSFQFCPSRHYHEEVGGQACSKGVFSSFQIP